jgi:hypothetical protein
MPSGRGLGALLAAALVFGVVAALVEGPGGVGEVHEVRSALGNLSTPWLLVGFLAGTRCSTMLSGALVGLAATMAALTGFYLVNALAYDQGAGSTYADLRLVFSANRGYLEGGLVTGLLFGLLGAWWSRRRGLGVSVVVGALLVAEPLVLVALGVVGPDAVASGESGLPLFVRLVPGWGLTTDRGDVALGIYAAELVLGLVILLLAVRRSARGRRPPILS